MRTIAPILSVAAFCATCTFGDLPQLRRETPQFVLPKRIARISPDLKRVGPWIDYQGGIAGTVCSTVISYDAFEPDIEDRNRNGFTNDTWDGYYGVDCGMGANRWLFTSYCNPFSVDDMTVQAGEEGRLTDRIQFIWRWHPSLIDPNAISESSLMVVFTTEEVSLTCTAPSAGGTFPGVIYNFGDLPDGFWATDVDLCTAGLNHEMPTDGQGGNILIGASEFTETGFVLGLCIQPGLWGTKHPNNIVAGTGPHFQDVVHWDDIAPADGSHDPAGECFSYALGFCPDPLGTAIVFYGDETDECAEFLCGDCNCDGALDGADIDPFFLALGDPNGWIFRYGALCDRLCVADINGDQTVDGADIDAFFAALGDGACP